MSTTPRWLLDLDEWKLCEYSSLKTGNNPVKYGIVSYTWGKWRDSNRVAAGKPANIRWDIPYVDRLPLDKAKKVMQTMKMRYVWWDWMCVPQRSTRTPLTDDEKRIAGEEIAKQMNIYKGAAASIVWLHNIEWSKSPLLASYLKTGLKDTEKLPYHEAFVEINRQLKVMKDDEPWLTSGWTLQEGVLLPDTPLLDYGGTTLNDVIFPTDKAIVAVISANINPLAVRVAKAFMYLSEHKSPSQGDKDGIGGLMQFIGSSPDSYKQAATFLADLLRSGLVGYNRNAPSFILTGRIDRRFSVAEDTCWALVGAMGIDVPNPFYADGKKMDEVRAAFFKPLLEKYQWQLFLIARMVDDKEWKQMNWARRIVEGNALPLEVYFGISWLNNLPQLKLDGSDRLVMSPKGATQIKFIDGNQRVYCRRYKQTAWTNGLVNVDRVEQITDAKSIFLPIANVEHLELPELNGSVRKGFRCLEVESTAQSNGRFLGIVDIWSIEAGGEEHFQWRQYMGTYSLT